MSPLNPEETITIPQWTMRWLIVPIAVAIAWVLRRLGVLVLNKREERIEELEDKVEYLDDKLDLLLDEVEA